MNVKNLRVAVVPTETGNGIDQRSTVEEILNCPETQLFALTDYFQAQNNSDIDLLHWSFLIDIETKEDLTGTNMDGVHYHSKAIKIGKIKAIITEWGSTSVCERERDHSPCLNSIGSGKNNVSELVEQFYADSVETVVYQDEITLSYNNYSYEELPDEIIDEILEIVEEYEADMLKTEKRCQS
jgi:hypothetical protein